MVRDAMNPVSIYPNFAVNPMMLPRRCCMKKKKKRSNPYPVSIYPNFGLNPSSSTSIEEITKESFDAVIRVTKSSPPSSSWTKSHFLGRGSYGSVYLATNKRSKAVVAIKSAELSRASSLIDEEKILKRLSSLFIVRCYGHEIVREDYNLILEYCSGKTLAELVENRGALDEYHVRVFVRHILSGLQHIHSKRIIHCDIKPENILLSPGASPNGYLAKIADFGLSMEKYSVQYGNGSGHRRGTTRYMAPELISHGIVDYAVDIWAFGCTVLEMLTGEPVWGEHDVFGPADWLHLIARSGLIPHIPDSLSEEARDFLRRCLVKDPGSRWGIGALMNHPFFHGDNGFLSI